MAVVVVTDSTCYLPAGAAAEHGIRVVPVQVIIGGQPYDETEDQQAQRVAQALSDWEVITTSRPSPERFARMIADAEQCGATGVVIATLSAALSATYESAVLAAKEASIPVEVVDSRSIAMGLGFAVLDGSAAAQAGGSVDEVARRIEESAASASVMFYVDTLEYLRRGGRVSAARAAVGQVLQVKPLLHIVDGRVEMFDKVRTAGKALARLADLAVAAAGTTPVRIAVQHLASPERAAALSAQLRGLLPGATVVDCPVGGVVGAHVGPGMVAVVVSPEP